MTTPTLPCLGEREVTPPSVDTIPIYNRKHNPMTTYDDLKSMIYEGDPLHEKSMGTDISLSEEGLFIPGYDNANGYAEDLLLTLDTGSGEPFVLRYREPHTETWGDRISFVEYEELVHWVYEL